MTDQARTRSRVRPAARTETEEVRDSGRAVHEASAVDQRPSGSVELFADSNALIFARVSIRDGLTLNTGNFNSFRRDVGMELDILITDDGRNFTGDLSEEQQAKVDRVYAKMEDWVTERVAESHDAAADYMES